MSSFNRKKRDKLSKFMSLILRHKPEQFGVILNQDGFCPTEDLFVAFQTDKYWKEATYEDILQIVKECPKQRFEIKTTNGQPYIRARYGHSSGNIEYKETKPPKLLIHGTYENAVDSIFKTGIQKMARNYVHLSETDEFATLAGSRRGKVVLLEIDTEKALKKDVKFHYAGHEVWLSTNIPIGCFEIKK